MFPERLICADTSYCMRSPRPESPMAANRGEPDSFGSRRTEAGGSTGAAGTATSETSR
jgi:hypothetical protein